MLKAAYNALYGSLNDKPPYLWVPSFRFMISDVNHICELELDYEERNC